MTYSPTKKNLDRDARELLRLLWRALAYLDSVGNHRKSE